MMRDDMRALRWREEDLDPPPATSPLDLIRGCLQRAVGWSILAGIVLGGGYVAVQLPFRPYGLPGGTPLVFLFLGTAQGFAAGLAVGVMCGIVFAVPVLAVGAPHRVRGYRPLLGLAGAGIAALYVWTMRLTTGWPYPYLASGPGDHLLGVLLAGLGGWWVGDRVARWRIREAHRALEG
jgi:hypothetical protein